MSGRFNPFQSKRQEVLRTHTVPDAGKARKLLAKFQRKRPCVWLEIPNPEEPAAVSQLETLDGATSVVLFLNGAAVTPLPDPLPPALDALVTRLWKNFNKLYLLRLGEVEPPDPSGDDRD
jgi:hypothetical protein